MRVSFFLSVFLGSSEVCLVFLSIFGVHSGFPGFTLSFLGSSGVFLGVF